MTRPGGSIADELSRRDFVRRVGTLGAGAFVIAALPVAERMIAAEPALAAVSLDDATLQAFADTVIPGRKVTRTDLGHEVRCEWRESPPGGRVVDELFRLPFTLQDQIRRHLARHPDTDVVVASQPYAYVAFRELRLPSNRPTLGTSGRCGPAGLLHARAHDERRDRTEHC